MAELSKKYDQTEVKRMYWSLVLLTFREAVEDDIRDARKNRDIETTLLQRKTTDGRSLGGNDDEKKKRRNLINLSFQKLWKSHSSWASKALTDGIEFAKTSKPRKNILKDDKSTVKDTAPLTSAFNKSVWPALRSRGWKEEVLPSGSKTSSCRSPLKKFTYGIRSFRTVASVLDTALLIHPELENMISIIISSVATKEDLK